MANVIKNFLGYLKLGEDDDYDEYLSEFEERENERYEKAAKTERQEYPKQERRSTKSFAEIRASDDNVGSEQKKERVTRTERSSSSKIIPIRKTSMGLEVCIIKPTSFEDSQEICDTLINGRAAVVNLEGFDPMDAQRIMDFISGAVYAINGKLHQISKYIFIFSPDSVDISGDYLDLLPEEGFGVPTINKEF